MAAVDNPIESMAKIEEAITLKFGVNKYIVSAELHQSGKTHYHAYFHFDDKVDSTDVRCFDLVGVHPNLIKAPGNGWQAYVAKHGDFITNFYEKNVFMEASDMATWASASDLLWAKQPRWMFQHSAAAEKSFKKRKMTPIAPRLYYGPYQECFSFDEDLFKAWIPDEQSLEVIGTAGLGKTQWARYHCAHDGGYFYCKGTLNCLRHYNNEPWIIFDDVTHDLKDCNALLDVENGGAIPARYADLFIPPGVKRMFIHNGGMIWTGHDGAIARRKYVVHA